MSFAPIRFADYLAFADWLITLLHLDIVAEAVARTPRQRIAELGLVMGQA